MRETGTGLHRRGRQGNDSLTQNPTFPNEVDYSDLEEPNECSDTFRALGVSLDDMLEFIPDLIRYMGGDITPSVEGRLISHINTIALKGNGAAR